MKLIELLVKEQIEPNLKGENKFQIIEELIDRLNSNQQVKNRDQALEDVLAREGYLSTGLENGLAVPHAKTAAAEEMAVSFGLSQKGLDFNSSDGDRPQWFAPKSFCRRDPFGIFRIFRLMDEK